MPAPLVVSYAAEKVALQLDISEPSKCLLSQPPPPGEKGITPESPLSQSSGCLSFDVRRIWPNRGEVSLDIEGKIYLSSFHVNPLLENSES